MPSKRHQQGCCCGEFVECGNRQGVTQTFKKRNPADGTQTLEVDTGGSGNACVFDDEGFVYIAGADNTVYKYQGDTEIWAEDFGAAVSEVCVDPDGNVYAVGTRNNNIDATFANFRKYDSVGNLEWSVDVDSDNILRGCDCDVDGNVVVCGSGSTANIFMYDTDGNQDWNYVTGLDTYSVALDLSGRVWSCHVSGFNIRGLLLDSDGTLIDDAWTIGDMFGSVEDVQQIRTDASGNAYYFGGDGAQPQWAKVSESGGTVSAAFQIERLLFGGGQFWCGAVDTSGNVYGVHNQAPRLADGASGDDYTTIKYDPTGTILWEADFGGINAFFCDVTPGRTAAFR